MRGWNATVEEIPKSWVSTILFRLKWQPSPTQLSLIGKSHLCHRYLCANFSSIIRDDMHISAGAHVGVMVIPAALALAQRESWSGGTLLKAIVAGYDMAVALGSALRIAGSCNPHFRPSGIIGAFAAAAVGIVAEERVTAPIAASALALAANMAAGLNEWPWAGGMEINTQVGTASRSGITSLDLAKAGILSSESVLEGRDGLFVAYGCGNDSAQTFREWITSEAVGAGLMGVKFKPVAGCNFVQTPIAVAMELSARVAGVVDEVNKIIIIITTAAKSYPGCDNHGPFNKIQQTKMSIQYAVAAALLFGKVGEVAYRQFDNEELETLIRKCSVYTDLVYDQELRRGKQPCRIEIITSSGQRVHHSLPDVPWLEASAVEERFREEAAAGFIAGEIDNVVSACQQLPGNMNCAHLLGLLRAYKPHPL